MKPLIYICFFLFSYISIACDYSCHHDFFKAYASSDIVIITKIDSLKINETGKLTGKYTAILNKEETLLIKGKLNKKLVGFYNSNYVCGGSYPPRLNRKRIIYAKLVNNEYVFNETACSKPLYIDDLNDYLSFKNSANFIPGVRRSQINQNFELHFLLNNIKFNNKIYDNELVKLNDLKSLNAFNDISVPNEQYMLFEVLLDKDLNYIKTKKIKRNNRSLQKEIAKRIKKLKWAQDLYFKPKKKYKILLKFDNIWKNHFGRLIINPTSSK